MALCSFCFGMFSLNYSIYDEWRHNWSRPEESLDPSCQLCRLIYARICDPKTLQRLAWNTRRVHVSAYVIEFWISPDHHNVISLKLQGPELKEFAYLPITKAPSLELAPAGTWRQEAAILGTATSSPLSLECAMNWLNKCKRIHAQCAALEKTKRQLVTRPKRLVHVKFVAGKLEARLVSCADIEDDVPYMTLSHCWGKIPVACLTRDTEDTYLRGIDTENISRVFRDAMFVTAKARVKHIWIDSLCIMQDSAEEWLDESIKMGDIYRHGTCNIAATGFSDGSSGLFVERDTRHIRPIKCTLPQPLSLSGFPVLGPEEISLIDQDAWKVEIENGHLNTRAWVVQERFLSPRTLHFGTSQIWWECCELVACEAYPDGLPSRA